MYRPKKATWRVNSRSVAIFALMLFLVEYFAVERCITPGEQFETPGTLAGPVKASATCFPSLYHFSARLVWKHLEERLNYKILTKTTSGVAPFCQHSCHYPAGNRGCCRWPFSNLWFKRRACLFPHRQHSHAYDDTCISGDT